MPDRAMLRRAQNAVRELQAEYYATAGDAFAHFAVRTYFELDDDDALIACDVGGPDDKGIDAYLHDVDGRRIIIAQAKHSARAKSFDRTSVVELQAAWSALQRLGGPDRKKAREQVIEAAREIRALREADPRYQVDLYSFVSGGFTQSAVDAAEAFNAEHADDGVACILVDMDELLEVLREQDSRLEEAPDEPIKLDLEQYFEFAPSDDEPLTIVASVNGKELAEIERQYQYRIFQRNVRYYLNARQRFNKGIATTLASTSGRRRFWYYNNGISIVCDAVEVTPTGDGRAVAHVTNLQIVNGCQTTTTLGANIDRLEDPESPAYVLVRIVAAPDLELQGDISLYNNRQNQVKDRDLQSNDNVQQRLQVEFAQLSHPWHYASKRGEWDAVVKPDPRLRALYGDRRLDNDKVAQAAYAFHFDPGVAKARKGYLFVRRVDDPDKGLYEDIFNESTTPEWLLLPYRLSVLIDERRKKYMKQLKEALEDPETNELELERLSQRGWLRFADQYLLGALNLYFSHKADLDQAVIESLLADDAAGLEAAFRRGYAIALRDLTHFFLDRHAEAAARDQTFVEANYVKGNWPTARKYLLTQIAMRDDMEEDPFEDIFAFYPERRT